MSIIKPLCGIWISPNNIPSVGPDLSLPVEVFDPNGNRSVLLEGLRKSATVAEISARALSELRLPADVDWNLRDERTGRLLQESQRLDDFAADETQVRLKMQPDAGLG